MKPFIVAAALLAIACSPALAQIAPKEWPTKNAELPLDERMHFGTLGNGMRYAWANQTKSDDKWCFLRLFVDAGSLVEQDSEQGVAHFIEHMAFNGTKNFKSDTLIKWFEDHGVKFGHDVNAHTSEFETVYEMDLPDDNPERLAKAMQWMRDVADGITFDEKEVAKEKGVIDAEERERAGANLRIVRTIELATVDGTLIPKRWPIGVKAVRDKFNAAVCKTFYKKWYRPEHMTFIVAGNLPNGDIEKLIKDAFTSWPTSKEPLPARPPIGAVKVAARAFSAYDKEATGCSLIAAKVKPYVKEPDTLADRRTWLIRSYALRFMNERFAKLAKQPGSPLDGASLGYWNQSDLIEGWALQVSCHPSKWQQALALARAELDRTLAEGFTQDELKEGLRGLMSYAAGAPEPDKYPAGTYLSWMLRMARGGGVVVDDRKEIELMKPVKNDFTLERLHQLLRDTWDGGELYLYSVGNLDLGKDAAKTLTQAWTAPSAASTTPTETKSSDKAAAEEQKSIGTWAYAAKGAEGKIATQNAIDDLKITQIEFANGVKAVLRQSDQFKSGVLMLVRVGDGRLALEPDLASIGWVTSNVLLRGGLGKHSWEDVKQLTDGTGFGFGVSTDSCLFQGSAGWEQCTRLFEVICAYLTDPAFAAAPFDEFMADLPRVYENVDKGVAGPIHAFERKLYSDDMRFGIPDRGMVESYSLDDVKAFIVPQLESGPVEIALIGGIPIDTMRKALARTFGLLPPRRARELHADRLKVAPLKSGIKLNKPIETETKAAVLRIVFPTTDGIDAIVRRKLYFLGEVIDEGLRVEVRENKGAAYSPSASSLASNIFPGFGWIQIDVEADPSKVDEVMNTCFKVTESLVKKGVKEDDVKRIRTIATTNHLKQLENDGFWFTGMFESLSNPKALDDLRNAKGWYDGITAAEVSELAKKYLPRAKASVCTVVPKKGANKKN